MIGDIAVYSNMQIMSKLSGLEDEITRFGDDETRSSETLFAELDYLLLEDSFSDHERRKLRELRAVLAEKQRLRDQESRVEDIYVQQRKALYDCNTIAMDVGTQLTASNQRLARVQETAKRINQRLLGSSSLVGKLQSTMSRQKALFRGICLGVCLFLVLILALRLR